MTYEEIRDQLVALINRSDMTDTLAANFIHMAQHRLERVLRLSFMQKFVSFNPPREDGVFRVPIDYLEMIDLFTDYGQLEYVDTARWLDYFAQAGCPKVYIQTGHDIRMRPWPATDDTLYLRYFGCEEELTLDDQTNQWTLCAPEALIYGAAIFAAHHFEDERLAQFQAQFDACVQELRDQQLQEDFSGPMSVQPAYRYDCDY